MPLPKDVALVYHFRPAFIIPTDNVTIFDSTMWKYKEDLISEVSKTLNETKFKP